MIRCLGRLAFATPALRTLRPNLSLMYRCRISQNASVPHLSHYLADTMVPKCTSCGITLQKNDAQKPGFFIEPKPETAPRPVKPSDAAFDSHASKLSLEDQQLLLNGASTTLLGEPAPLTQPRNTNRGTQCLRCRRAHYQSEYDPSQLQIESVESVMEKIPSTASVVYVVSASDFPMSLDETVFRFRPASKMQFVITKTDLFFPTNNSASKNGHQFFQDYLGRLHHVPPSNVHVVSGKEDWNTEKFLESVKDHTYFIGAVNSGKSTLLQSLVHVAAKVRSAFPNARHERDLQKTQDTVIKKFQSRAAVREQLRHVARYKSDHGPGVSYMPGFTRGIMPIELGRNSIVYDVPGFARESQAQLPDLLTVTAIRSLLKGVPFHKRGTYMAKYETAKEGQVITVGGLFFLKVPMGCMYRVRNMINHPVHIFRNMDKALQVWREPSDAEAVKDVFLVNPAAVLKKHIAPPFSGSFDLVLRCLGFVSITATGKRPDVEEPIEVYLPAGIDAISREPLGKYITRTLSGRDKNGNVLRKEKWVKLSTKEVKRFVAKEPFCRPVVPVNSS